MQMKTKIRSPKRTRAYFHFPSIASKRGLIVSSNQIVGVALFGTADGSLDDDGFGEDEGAESADGGVGVPLYMATRLIVVPINVPWIMLFSKCARTMPDQSRAPTVH